MALPAKGVISTASDFKWDFNLYVSISKAVIFQVANTKLKVTKIFSVAHNFLRISNKLTAEYDDEHISTRQDLEGDFFFFFHKRPQPLDPHQLLNQDRGSRLFSSATINESSHSISYSAAPHQL